jgi:imidazole glycerol-phosphate synthase subunit HisF
MFRPRIIPVLLLQDEYLVKTVQFSKPKYIGDPINAVSIFNDLQADELVFLDIEATKEKRLIDIDFVKQVGEEANMPFAVGGGIRNIEDIQTIISAGAERVVIGSYAVENPDFIREAANEFGSSTISVCIDVKKKLIGKQFVFSLNGTQASHYDPIQFAKLMQEKGAGELIIQSIMRDGTMEGYDMQLLRKVSEVVSIPVVALGGVKDLNEMKKCFEESFVSGVAAGSLFVYQGFRRGVLINYPDRKQIVKLFS